MHWLWSADDSLFRLLNGHPSVAPVRALAGVLLRLGVGGALWWAIFLLAFVAGGRRGRRIAVTGAVAVLLAHITAVWGLEGLVQRADPSAVLSRGVFTLPAFQPRFSFPASEAAQAFAAVPFLRRSGGAGSALAWLLAAGTAWAEVYAGASFPTDAVAGLLVGLLCARGALWLLGNPFRRPVGQVIPIPRRPRPGGAARTALREP